MPHEIRDEQPRRLARIRETLRHRAPALAAALGLEVLLVLLLLSVVPNLSPRDPVDMAMDVFDVTTKDATVPASPAAATPDQPDTTASDPSPADSAPPPPSPAPSIDLPTPPAAAPIENPAPAPIPWIELNREQMASADVARRTPAPATPAAPGRSYGPQLPRGVAAAQSGDTPRVEGSGPNGEPLYAAAWYREPYDDELRGYLSTARGPGWGLIMCRTVADFRVADCVALGESPQGSNIARAVLAAAWQFRVRPPRIGGRTQVGEWVRIRIDYSNRPQ